MAKTTRSTILLAAASLALITGCAALGPARAYHALSFDASDIPGVSILDYQYKTGNAVIRGVSQEIKNQKGFHGLGALTSSGSMAVGDTLYVKWKSNDTGVIKEDSIGLHSLLPSDMNYKRILFIVDPGKVNVYLVQDSPIRHVRCAELNKAARNTVDADARAKATYCEYQISKIYPVAKQLLD